MTGRRPPELVADRTWGRVRVVVTGRRGGHSQAPYDGANLASAVGDDPSAVAANRRSLAGVLGVPPGRLHFLRQVHGARVVDVPPGEAAGPGDEEEGDAAVVTLPGRAAAVTVADCVPLVLADPGAGRAAVVHVGRRGLVAGTAARAVERLHGHGAGDLRALVGPAVCGACYEVPADMRDEVEAAVPGSAARTSWGTPSVDVVAGLRRQLVDLGIGRVEEVRRCTVEDRGLFSHRRDRRTGRFAAAVAVLP